MPDSSLVNQDGTQLVVEKKKKEKGCVLLTVLQFSCWAASFFLLIFACGSKINFSLAATQVNPSTTSLYTHKTTALSATTRKVRKKKKKEKDTFKVHFLQELQTTIASFHWGSQFQAWLRPPGWSRRHVVLPQWLWQVAQAQGQRLSPLVKSATPLESSLQVVFKGFLRLL